MLSSSLASGRSPSSLAPQLPTNRIPKLQARFEGFDASLFGFQPFLVVLLAEVVHHLDGHGAVLVAVQFNVAVEVIDKGAQLLGVVLVELFDEGRKHIWDEVFTAKGEGSSDFVQLAALNDGVGGFEKVQAVFVHFGDVEAENFFGFIAALKRLNEPNNRPRLRAHLTHGVEVEFVVAGGLAIEVNVALFGDHDFIDELSARAVLRRYPGRIHRRQLALKRLEQAHKVPNGVDVVLHENAHLLERLHLRVERVVENGVALRLDAAVQAENSEIGLFRRGFHRRKIILGKSARYCRLHRTSIFEP